MVTLPGQPDPTQVTPDVLEKLEKSLTEESDQCAEWLREFLRKPSARMATHDCFSLRAPYFLEDRGCQAPEDILKAEICLDLGSFLFFKVR